MRGLLLLAALALQGCACIGHSTQLSLVIVVRHAERAPEPRDDPGLSAEGVQRAQALAEHLASAHVTSIITTHYRRSQETALPTAKRFGIEPTIIAVRREEREAHVPEVVAAIRRLTGVVLVVGHSDTVTDIVAALSDARPLPLCDTSFSNVFVVGPQSSGTAVLQFKYGQADPAPSAGCQ